MTERKTAMTPREEVVERSGGMCEAMVRVGMIWARCGIRPIEVHHALTRARGGHLLDRMKESYHLIALCNKHHQGADGGDAYDAGLLIDGWVESFNNKVVYHGTDPYLKEKYPK